MLRRDHTAQRNWTLGVNHARVRLINLKVFVKKNNRPIHCVQWASKLNVKLFFSPGQMFVIQPVNLSESGNDDALKEINTYHQLHQWP